MSNRKTVSLILSHLLLIFFSALFALPLFWLISTSLKPNTEILSFPVGSQQSLLGTLPTAIEFIPSSAISIIPIHLCPKRIGSVVSCS